MYIKILLRFYLFDLPKNHFSDIIQTENKMDAQKNHTFDSDKNKRHPKKGGYYDDD